MILIPKRKLPDDEGTQAIIEHTTEIVYAEMNTGYTTTGTTGDYTYRLKIPARTDWYD